MSTSHATVAVPDTLDEALSPTWLTAALGMRFPGVKVTDVEPGPVVRRVSTNALFRIKCAGGLPEGLPAELCVKGYFHDLSSGEAGVPEAAFYRDLAAASGVRTLRSVYSGINAENRHGVVITEDISAQGATFLDGRSVYTPDQVAESLAQLARLHARTWDNAPWLTSRLADTMRRRGLAEIQGNFDGPISAGVPEEVRDALRLFDAYGALAAEVAAAKPTTVIHGDPHVGNVYLDGTGRPCWLDWQLVQRGMWYLDVGYHLAAALTVEDRRRSERDLLRHYLDARGAFGGPVPSWDEALAGIRRGILLGFYLWGITLLVEPAVTKILLTRLGTAAADHDSLNAVARS